MVLALSVPAESAMLPDPPSLIIIQTDQELTQFQHENDIESIALGKIRYFFKTDLQKVYLLLDLPGELPNESAHLHDTDTIPSNTNFNIIATEKKTLKYNNYQRQLLKVQAAIRLLSNHLHWFYLVLNSII